MALRAKIGWTLLVLFALVNAFGTVWAGVRGEVAHTAIHVVLLVPAVFLIWRRVEQRIDQRRAHRRVAGV